MGRLTQELHASYFASFGPVDECLREHAQFCGRASHGYFAPIEHHVSVPLRIGKLIFERCPSAIRRFVVAIVIDTLKRQSWLALSHVGKKCREVVKPSFAQPDASPAITVIVGSAWICATSFGRSPRAVFPRSASVVRLLLSGSYFPVVASTTAGVCIQQVLTQDYARAAAIAQAFPSGARPRSVASAIVSTNDQQSVKSLTDEIALKLELSAHVVLDYLINMVRINRIMASAAAR